MSKSLIAEERSYLTQVEAACALELTLAQLRHRRRLGILPPPDVQTGPGSPYYYSQEWLKRAKALLKPKPKP